MSFLELLKSDLTDQELFNLVNQFEIDCLFSDVSDDQLLLDVLTVEEQFYIDSLWDSCDSDLVEAVEIVEMWSSDSDSQLLKDVTAIEDQADILSGMSDRQLLHD